MPLTERIAAARRKQKLKDTAKVVLMAIMLLLLGIGAVLPFYMAIA